MLTRGARLLRRWRDRNKLSQPEAAALFGLNFMQVSRFERGCGVPGRVNSIKIESATGGAVPVESWSVAAVRKAG